jgi:hypothetical protein
LPLSLSRIWLGIGFGDPIVLSFITSYCSIRLYSVHFCSV